MKRKKKKKRTKKLHPISLLRRLNGEMDSLNQPKSHHLSEPKSNEFTTIDGVVIPSVQSIISCMMVWIKVKYTEQVKITQVNQN